MSTSLCKYHVSSSLHIYRVYQPHLPEPLCKSICSTYKAKSHVHLLILIA